MTSLSTYDFSTLYTTLSHNLIKEKLLGLIERTFKRDETLYLACTYMKAFLLLQTIDGINFLTHLDLYQSLYDFIAEARNNIMVFWLLFPVYSGSLKTIDYPKRSVWTTLFLLNVFTVLKGTHFYIFIWSCQNVCDALSYLVDNIYIRFDTKLTVIQTNCRYSDGANCALLVADFFFLICYERDYMKCLSDGNQADIIEAFNSS